MKRKGLNYHVLHILNSTKPKLRKAIISNCDNKLVNCISECVLNILKGNIALTVCDKRSLRKHKVALRKIVANHVDLRGNEWLIVKRGVLPTVTTCRSTMLANLISAK